MKKVLQTPASVEPLFPWCHFPLPIFNSLHNKIKGVPVVHATVAKQRLNRVQEDKESCLKNFSSVCFMHPTLLSSFCTIFNVYTQMIRVFSLIQHYIYIHESTIPSATTINQVFCSFSKCNIYVNHISNISRFSINLAIRIWSHLIWSLCNLLVDYSIAVPQSLQMTQTSVARDFLPAENYKTLCVFWNLNIITCKRQRSQNLVRRRNKTEVNGRQLWTWNS